MRAIRVLDHGTGIVLQTVTRPEPGPGELRLRVTACGLNFADLLMIGGSYQATPPLPFTPGLEMAGVVEALGPGTEGPPIGTRVAAFHGQGGLAEAAVVPAGRCIPLPDSMEDTVAAGFQVAYGTSHLALARRAGLASGETLAVLGAAGGVGLTAVELGRRMGARVVAVARGEEKRRIARDAGAEITLDPSEDLTTRLRDLGGIDVLYDPVGGDAAMAAQRALRPEGRHLVVGFASGDVPQVRVNHLMVKNIDLLGIYWGGYLGFAPDALTGSLAELMDWHARGHLRPHVSHVLPLDRTEEALDLLASRRATGKVVVTP